MCLTMLLMHSTICMHVIEFRVEWGIGGLKRNFARLMKPLDAMNPSIHIVWILYLFNKLSSLKKDRLVSRDCWK